MLFRKMKLVLLVMCVLFLVDKNVQCGEEEKLLQLSKTWADRLGADLWVFGLSVTRKDAFFERYNKSASISLKDGDALTLDIEVRIREMMEQKVLAVQRIMDAASNLAASSKDDPDPDFSYYSAKELINNLTNPPSPNATQAPHAEEYKQTVKLLDPLPIDDELPQSDDTYQDDEPLPEDTVKVVSDSEAESVQASQQESHTPPPVDKRYLNLTENPNFFNIPVNMEHSAVHVPSNVYNKSKDVIQGIIWSDKLDSIFVENYRADPTLSWQYFGSGTGFMRQFPAMIWHQEPVDVFDCRTRAWYIEAASSPKDVVVLVDRSGSMTGMQQEIAKHVVNNILDTLGNNDYVNIFLFSNVTDPLVPCFNDTLVQANLANVRELKEGMEEYKTENIANFSDALTVAFKLLENYRIGSRNKSGAGCNQAIMLVTDGVQYNYKELFEAYNWRDWPYKPVRVFTYLIGREVSDVREVKWMACANQGYYVHLSTFAEVREQVLHYIPVMARPMVLWANPPQPTWSPVYADVTDPKLTNWLWTQRQRRDQRERFLSHRKHPHRHTSDQDKKWVHQQKKPQDHYGDLQSYTLMTSVSMPVYDRRQNAVDSQLKIQKYMCTNCLSILECFYNFKQACVRNSNHLNTYLQSLTVSDKTYKELSVRVIDIQQQKANSEDEEADPPNNEDIIVKEESFISEDTADIQFYHEFVKCEPYPPDSNTSNLDSNEDIPEYPNNSNENVANNPKLNKVKIRKTSKKFQCTLCNKGYSNSKSLQYHLKVHAGIKDFSCSICNRKFTLRSHLIRHENIHTGIKNFECFICKKKFMRNSDMTRHKKIHIGVKNFECKTCKKLFMYKCNLAVHEKQSCKGVIYKKSAYDKKKTTQIDAIPDNSAPSDQ